MTPTFIAALSDHLWQSTVVVAVVGLLTLLLRRNRAQVRYVLWLAASVKFLVPFAWLEVLGQRFQGATTPPVVQRDLVQAIETVSQPFTTIQFTESSSLSTSSGLAPAFLTLLGVVWLAGCALHLLAWRKRWSSVAAIARQAVPAPAGREAAVLRRLEGVGISRQPLPVVLSAQTVEPAVFGVLRPVLLWPRDLGERIGDAQLEALLAHELCHVRRRDNMAMALHMLVEAVFWFHPLVWLIERRLVDERERACDEDVIRRGSDPRVYAEGILKTSELCVESPLACASGITGSDLRARIEAIMRRCPCQALGGWRRFVVWTAASVAVIAPLSLGALDVPLLRAQEPPAASAPAFEVASVKPNKSSEARASFGGRVRGQLTVVNNTLRNMIRNAYQLQEYQIVGGPDWINDDRFDITAKAANSDTPPLQLLAMAQTLLADRFKLRVHRETREVPVYALVMARDDRRLGPRLQKAAADCDALVAALGRGGAPPPSAPAGERPPCGIRLVPGRMLAGGSLLSDVGRNLAPSTGRLVIDRTGLTGRFDLDLEWTPDQMPPPPPPGAPPSVLPPPPADGPSLFAAIQEQLGLKLEATRGPVEVLVIDSAERPQPD